jgi:sulfopyruvate decarboxylase subunit beta
VSVESQVSSAKQAVVDTDHQRMKRADALAAIYPTLARDDVIVTTIMGAVAVELYNLGHRPGFFYLEHAMGLASSLGLGLALSLPRNPVVAIDGDGSLLMNLGTLSTLARYRPGNLTHLVFDNESLLSVGGFPTATATGTDLAGIAVAAGVPAVVRADTVDAFAAAFEVALAGPGLTTIVAKVAAVGPASFHMDLPLLENRFQFWRHCRALAARAAGDGPRRDG